MMGASRGMALVQALIIVSAIAVVSTSLLQRTNGVRMRLEARNAAEQAALHLNAGVDYYRTILNTMPAEEVVFLGQEWAIERDRVEVGDGILSWEASDLGGRFNLNTLVGAPGSEATLVFLRLAASQRVPQGTARRIVDLLSGDDGARARAAGNGMPPALPLTHPRQLMALGQEFADVMENLMPFLATRAIETPLNINTVSPELLAALLPDMGRVSRNVLVRQIEDQPFESVEDIRLWAEATLPERDAQMLSGLAWTITSALFEVSFSVQLDSVYQERTVVISRSGSSGRAEIVLSMAE